MSRHKRFTFLISQEERALITSLAEHLQRSQSDAVRWLVINAARELVERMGQLMKQQDQGDGDAE